MTARPFKTIETRKFHRFRKRFRCFSIPRDFGGAPPNFGRSFGWSSSWDIGRDFGRKIASNVYPLLGISDAIAWHVGPKIYNISTFNAGNHAKIFGANFKIPCFAFERHVTIVHA